MWRRRTLASQILLGVLAILLVTMAVGIFLVVRNSRETFDTQYERRALAVATTVAHIPEVERAIVDGDPTHLIRRLADDIAHATGAAYVVVADRAGTRYSHPNPALIGLRLEEGVQVLDGRPRVGVDNGSLGRSANGKAPIFDARGQVVGEVSVGVLEKEVGANLRHEVLIVALYLGLALGVGVLASLLLSRLIKRATFGLELSEITSLLQEREAMLHGIREGVVGLDERNRVTVLNSEAHRLLQVTASSVGRPVDEVVPPGRLRDLLSGRVEGTDEVVLTDEFLLVVNRMPVVLGGRAAGAVVTLRDRTELESLIRELNAVTGLTNALRAQEHEFTNRLHILSSLLELGESDEATSYLAELSAVSITQGESLRARVSPPVVAALLLAKVTMGTEQGIDLRISEGSHLEATPDETRTLLTVLGNLVDNALEAVAATPEPRSVLVELSDDDGLQIVVSDSGPGIAAEAVEDIFRDGYSTKSPRGRVHRGLGLALVHRLVRQAGGTIGVTSGTGCRFSVWLPRAGAATADHVSHVGEASP
ncbi:MAG TPA: sensor histidine kinase [Jatrophihabitantaceae bacterium]|jgi:two-component system CitB family sensor kinase|nr:sensor histidine kinase [Jatrophihabitantaceae bacterium]